LNTTACANGIIQLTLRTTVATAAAATIAATAAIATTATATALLGSITTRLALSRGLESFRFVKGLFFFAKRKLRATGSTDDLGCSHLLSNL
jgi:2-methylaconitate cis-trans-isomerase PrpF